MRRQLIVFLAACAYRAWHEEWPLDLGLWRGGDLVGLLRARERRLGPLRLFGCPMPGWNTPSMGPIWLAPVEPAELGMNQAVYTLVLTHDIDAMTLRDLPPGRTLAGFFYRCLVENLGRLLSGRISLGRYLASVSAVGTYFPAKLGIGLDVWARSLGSMLSMERECGVRSTLFVIPIARQAGVMPGNGNVAPRQRAAHYRIQDWSQLLRRLVGEGWEVGVHGVNAWRGEVDARAELAVLREACPEQAQVGVRMHWLYSRPGMQRDLEAAGYAYDATLGWNDRVGFPEGRYRPFRAERTEHFMVLPLNIQDGALLSREYRNLDLRAAWRVVQEVLNEARANHGVVTVLWHNTSFVAPRFWGDLYGSIVQRALDDGAAVVTAGAAVERFRE